MANKTEDELLNDDLDSDAGNISKEDEDFLLNNSDEEEQDFDSPKHSDSKDENHDDLYERDDVLELELDTEDLQDGLIGNEEEPPFKRSEKFVSEKEQPSVDIKPNWTEKKIFNMSAKNTRLNTNNNRKISPLENATNCKKQVPPQANDRNIRNHNIKRGGRHQQLNPRNNNTQKKMSSKKVYVNPNFGGSVQVQENQARLAYDNPGGSNINPWISGSPFQSSPTPFFNNQTFSNTIFGNEQKLNFEPPLHLQQGPYAENFSQPLLPSPPNYHHLNINNYQNNQDFGSTDRPFSAFNSNYPPPLMHMNLNRPQRGCKNNFGRNNFRKNNRPNYNSNQRELTNKNSNNVNQPNKDSNVTNRDNVVRTNTPVTIATSIVPLSTSSPIQKRKSVEKEVSDKRQKVEEMPKTTVIDETEEDRIYRLKIEEQKKERERILKLKEERRMKALQLEMEKAEASAVQPQQQQQQQQVEPQPKPVLNIKNIIPKPKPPSSQPSLKKIIPQIFSDPPKAQIQPNYSVRVDTKPDVSVKPISVNLQYTQSPIFKDVNQASSLDDFSNYTFKVKNNMVKNQSVVTQSNTNTSGAVGFMANRKVVVKSSNKQPVQNMVVGNSNYNAGSVEQGSSFFTSRKIQPKEGLLKTKLVRVDNLSANTNASRLKGLAEGVGPVQVRRFQ